ncbi:MAG: glycerate kinase [Eggerthellaceae bacterium]|nr:glycerate kinase [Eggerthellaceae bacterium]
MKLVFASDSFKGTLSSARIGELLVEAAQQELPGAECVVFQIADGGEGTLDAIRASREGERITFSAHDGLMRPVEGEVFSCDGKAFVEGASTCGLTLLESEERDPLKTTSYGVGECIRHALDTGCGEVVVGLGGSCTNDGGMGCLRALGIKFFDADGHELLGCGADLVEVARIDERGLHPLVKSTAFTIMGDVDNPLLGPNGATRIFGRQKGADDAALDKLESGMASFAKVIEAAHPGTDFDTPGFGAAGGLGMALSVFLGARMQSGIEELLSAVGFDEAIEGADLVVTGEGKLDGQSLRGKAVSGIAAHAKRAGVPVAALCGTVALEGCDLRNLDLSYVIDISEGQPLDYALAHAEQNYLQSAKSLFSSLREGASQKEPSENGPAQTPLCAEGSQGEPPRLEIRKSAEGDLDRIMEVYAIAREFMVQNGNPNQWGPTNWPPEALVRNDIAQGKSYVCVCKGRIVGVFFYDFGKDIEPTYAHIEDGLWLDGSPYGVVHRIASDGSVKGVGVTCLNWAFEQSGHLRIDTHGDNVVMQRLLTKLGFVHCGTSYVEEDDYPRLAFEKLE